MTIELDTTLAQAEVLFLSFAQLVADVDRRQAEGTLPGSHNNKLRHRKGKSVPKPGDAPAVPALNDNLRELLKASR
jgi:TBC1 domain family member 15